ncbi:arylamine N-acetyltransferase [Gordonia sp. NB41Y]|uniref:arylamine N-acetyltransferase family protein n=1 Tax=Gordonia sp. NB41Y TaxID=875808 RepID=UPI0002C01384|nr:arylamine N-acetyltransferase [Gordonia sp. NB41Y]WLP89500.1 arylamine N-acetyltransferase [Gordonia sp. NB41Y]
MFESDISAPFPISDYLARIGLDRPERVGPDEVQRIATAHHAVFPFENLDVHLGIPYEVDPERIVSRLLYGRRGGCCYDLNGLLLLALQALGVDVAAIGARVDAGDRLGPPLGHMALIVFGHRSPLLVDVGFGGEMVWRPIDLTSETDLRVDVGSAAYVLEDRCRDLVEFEAMAWWHSTSPRSRFTRSLICTLVVDGVRWTLGDADDPGVYRLVVTDAAGRRTSELDLAGARDVLSRVIGLDIDGIPLTAARFEGITLVPAATG